MTTRKTMEKTEYVIKPGKQGSLSRASSRRT
jgi:hypothetical protein